MKVNFITPTRISLIDITSMGDSSKRGDDTTIGQFDSGLKYAIAILLRNDVKFSIHVQGEPKIHEHWEEDTTEEYTFGTYVYRCDNTGKEKELIEVHCKNTPHGGECMNQFDMREPSGEESWSIPTGFAKALGYNWELWMSLRELYSNMMDEGGHIGSYFIEDGIEGTVMSLEFDEDSPFGEIWKHRHLYINEAAPRFEISRSVEALSNPEGFLRIYKQNILVYKDEKVPSRYAYNIRFGEIDERRILTQLHGAATRIAESILTTDNEDFIREIITSDFECQDKEFLTNSGVYYSASDLMHQVATEVYQQHGKVSSYPWVMMKIRERKDCEIEGKVIKSVGDHLWNYSSDVKVQSPPVEFAGTQEQPPAESSFADELKKLYKFNLDVEVKKASLSGSKVIADKHKKCLIIDENFDPSKDMPEFIVQYIDLTREGNILKNISEFVVDLIRK